MKVTRVGPLTVESVDKLEADGLLLFVARDERPLQGLAGLVDWRLAGGVSRLLKKSWITGEVAEHVLAPGSRVIGIERILTVGLGPADDVTAKTLEEAVSGAADAATEAAVASLVVGLPGVCGVHPEEAAEALRKGLAGHYEGKIFFVGPTELSRILEG